MKLKVKYIPILFQRNCHGNAVVEFALIVPVLLIMLVGLVDGGRAISANGRLGSGINDGLRYAVTDPYADNAIEEAALAGSQFSSGEVDVSVRRYCECPDGSPITCTDTCDAGYRKIIVEIAMSRTQQTLFSYPVIGDSITISRMNTLLVP